MKCTHQLKVPDWCGICNESVIGPYFLEDTEGTTITVTGERYRQTLNDFICHQLLNWISSVVGSSRTEKPLT